MDKQKEKIRILLTEQCNANCASCFNKNIRNGLHMDMDEYRQLIDYLSGNGISFLKIMGGEPTVHPHFEEAVRLAQDKFAGMSVFTNALNERIKNIKLRKGDLIIYNYSFFDQAFDLDKMLLDEPGYKILEVQISSATDTDDLTASLGYLFLHITDDRVKISLTLDCMEDIYARRDLIIEKWNLIANFILKDLHKLFVFDHSIPWCFFENTDMKIRHEIRQCNIHCAGLITADFWLQHCNQYQKKEIRLKTENGFIPYEQLLHSLRQMNEEKIQINKEKACSKCANFLIKCNGGCFMHKSFIDPTGIPIFDKE